MIRGLGLETPVVTTTSVGESPEVVAASCICAMYAEVAAAGTGGRRQEKRRKEMRIR